jgi:hypothetical protein
MAHQRRRTKQRTSFEERLIDQARSFREQAETLPPGGERDSLILRARQAETASHINAWITSPGLRSPK